MGEDERIKSAAELVEKLRAEECYIGCPFCTGGCQSIGFCRMGWTPAAIADLIEHLARMACTGCGACIDEPNKNYLDCEIIGTEVLRENA